VDLQDPWIELAREVRDAGRGVGTGGQHDLRSLPARVARANHVSVAVVGVPEAVDPDAHDDR
jgi:hypothetical protein